MLIICLRAQDTAHNYVKEAYVLEGQDTLYLTTIHFREDYAIQGYDQYWTDGIVKIYSIDRITPFFCRDRSVKVGLWDGKLLSHRIQGTFQRGFAKGYQEGRWRHFLAGAIIAGIGIGGGYFIYNNIAR